jgi:hypothetical protein
MKLLGVAGVAPCGCIPRSWVTLELSPPQLLCFRHAYPLPAAEVVENPFASEDEPAIRLVARFLEYWNALDPPQDSWRCRSVFAGNAGDRAEQLFVVPRAVRASGRPTVA